MAIFGFLLVALNAAAGVQDKLKEQIHSEIDEGSANPLVRFWSLLELTIKPAGDNSLMVPSSMLKEKDGTVGPSRLLFPTNGLSQKTVFVLALTSSAYRADNPFPSPKVCTSSATFDDCCTNSPYVSCFIDSRLLSESFPSLRKALIVATAADLLAGELSQSARNVSVIDVGAKELQSNSLYFVPGFTPDSNGQRFVTIELTGRRLEAITEVVRNVEPVLARVRGDESRGSSSYECAGGTWSKQAASGLDAAIAVSPKQPVAIRSPTPTEYRTILLGARNGRLVVSIESGQAATSDSFYSAITSPAIRGALAECFGSQFAGVVSNQPGLLNLLKDEDLSLLLAYTIFLGAFWQSVIDSF